MDLDARRDASNRHGVYLKRKWSRLKVGGNYALDMLRKDHGISLSDFMTIPS